MPRVFIFDVTFSSDGQTVTPTQSSRPKITLDAAAAYLPGPLTEFGLNVDSPPSGSRLQFAIGVQNGNRFTPEIKQDLSQARERTIGCSPFGPGGAILLSASLSDWKLTVDTSGVVGPRTLMAKLIGYDGNLLDQATAPVVFDDVPPQNLQVVLPVGPATAGQPCLIKALAIRSLSGVTSAQFFVGLPLDGKIPDKTPTISGTAFDEEKLEWYAEVPIPADATGTVPITVQFTNAVGLSDVATANIAVQSAEQAGLGTILGKVTEGPLPQPDLTVTLSTAAGQALFQATTVPFGSFRFPNLTPGMYKLATAKAASNRKGEGTATVEAGKTATADISLQL